MHFRIKEKLNEEQVIDISEIRQLKLISYLQDSILPISKELAMFLFSSVPIDYKTYKNNDMTRGVIHDVINFSDIKSGEFFMTSFVIMKDNYPHYICNTSYLKSTTAFSFYCNENNKNTLLWCRYCNNLDELLDSLKSQINSLLSEIVNNIKGV